MTASASGFTTRARFRSAGTVRSIRSRIGAIWSRNGTIPRSSRLSAAARRASVGSAMRSSRRASRENSRAAGREAPRFGDGDQPPPSPRSPVYYSVRGRSSRYPRIKPRWTPRCGASVGAPLAAGCPRMSARRCSLARPPASPVIVFTVRGKTFIDTIDERDSIPPLPLLHDHPSGAARGSGSAPCWIVATGDPRGPPASDERRRARG
jgi:hypothetical protein